MFICSEIEAKSFGDRSRDICTVSIKRVIWDQFLAFRALIIEKNAFLTFNVFNFLVWSHLVLFCSPLKSFFCPN